MMMSGAESEITGVDQGRRKIRLIEGNAKCRYLKNLPVKGICGRRIILSEAPSPPMTPYSPPPYTRYTCIPYILIHTGKGSGLEELTRDKVRGAIVLKACRNYQHD
jgi:hypothetical protein